MVKFLIIIFLWILTANNNRVFGQEQMSVEVSKPVVQVNYYERGGIDMKINNILLLFSGLFITFGLYFLIEPKEIININISFLENFSKFINRLL